MHLNKQGEVTRQEMVTEVVRTDERDEDVPLEDANNHPDEDLKTDELGQTPITKQKDKIEKVPQYGENGLGAELE
jgi:hypothetical protein